MCLQRLAAVKRHRFGKSRFVIEIHVGRRAVGAVALALPNLFNEGEALVADTIDPGVHKRLFLKKNLVQIVDVHVHQRNTPTAERKVGRQYAEDFTSSGLEPDGDEYVVDVADAIGFGNAGRDRRFEHRRQAAVQPPSIINADPVTSPDASEAR